MLNWNSDGEYFDVIEPTEMDSSILNSPKFEGDSLRKVVLRKIPKDNYFVKVLQKVVHNTRPKIGGKDCGHLIADSFQDYLLTKFEIEEHQREVHQFCGKGNNVNIRSQSPESNRNSTELAGQLKEYLMNALAMLVFLCYNLNMKGYRKEVVNMIADLNLDLDFDINEIEVLTLSEAKALPETAASAGSASCCSCCGSCSCCSSSSCCC